MEDVGKLLGSRQFRRDRERTKKKDGVGRTKGSYLVAEKLGTPISSMGLHLVYQVLS